MSSQLEFSKKIFRFVVVKDYRISFKAMHVFPFLLYCMVFMLLNSCKDVPEKTPIQEPIIQFLKDPKNIKNVHYIDSFQTHYNRAIREKNIEKGASLLEAYGINLDANFQPDSLYVTTCEAFLKQHEAVLTNYQKIALNYYMGSQYDFLGNFEKSDLYLQKTNLPAQEKEEIKLRAFAGEIIATHLKLQGKFEDALKQTNQNITAYQKIKDTNNLAMSYSNLASIYKNLKAYDESDKYNKKSLALAISVKDTVRIWTSYVNLSRPNGLDIQPKKSLQYALKAKQLLESWKNATNREKSYTYASYARALLSNKKLDSVAFYIAKTEEIGIPSGRLKFDLMGMQAELDLLNGKPLRNADIFEKEYELAKQNKDFLVVEMIATILADHAMYQKDYKKAYDYTKEKYTLRDEAWMNDTKNQVAFLDKKFQTAQKEQVIAEQKLKITKSNYLIYAVIVLLIIFILLWAIINIRQKRKLALEEAQKQEQFTFQLLQNTEEERSRIANELHDSVNHNLLTLKNSLINGKTIAIDEVANVIEEVRNISRNLHPAILETVGLEASIENLCERLTEVGLFTTCEIEYTQKLSKNKELQLYRIIQEALNNTLKHGQANAAKVQLISKENYLQLEIKDNGNGFDVNEQLNNPKSFGLQSILQRAKAIMAKINIDSNPKGTIILLKIPV